MALSTEEQERLAFEASRVFRPAAPINQRALFAGRVEQLRGVIDAVNQPGQHAIVFGERGVGKTSLANVLFDIFRTEGEDVIAPKINCDTSDDFSSLWRKVFGEIQIAQQTRRAGFAATDEHVWRNLADVVPEKLSPYDVRRALTLLGTDSNVVIIIIDEFDRVRNGESSSLLADTIKTLSDQDVPATLVVVGVADSVNDLIREHLSIERALVQVRMPRMSREELEEIVMLGLNRLEMQIETDALAFITSLSQGLPHYTHLLSLYAAREAIDYGSREIQRSRVHAAINKALANAQQSILSAHNLATTSPRKENLFAQVLLACALAPHDELGYFYAADVRQPMTLIMGKRYDIPAFARHLNRFCEPSHGAVLQKAGGARRLRFRFSNPLIQPFVVMQGLSRGLIEAGALEKLTEASNRPASRNADGTKGTR